MEEKAAGSSSGTAHDAAVQRTAAIDSAGSSLEPKRDHARGTGYEPVAGGDEERQREAQRRAWEKRLEEHQRAAQQHDEVQQREAQCLEGKLQYEEKERAAQQQDEAKRLEKHQRAAQQREEEQQRKAQRLEKQQQDRSSSARSSIKKMNSSERHNAHETQLQVEGQHRFAAARNARGSRKRSRARGRSSDRSGDSKLNSGGRGRRACPEAL
jgi:hypothetical protein